MMTAGCWIRLSLTVNKGLDRIEKQRRMQIESASSELTGIYHA